MSNRQVTVSLTFDTDMTPVDAAIMIMHTVTGQASDTDQDWVRLNIKHISAWQGEEDEESSSNT